MSEPLRVAILWHMHQPYYLDDLTGRVSLPWVRLHATKAYTDLTTMLQRHPEMACTINVVPSLLAQLQAYDEREDIQDDFLTVSRKEADELDDDEKLFLMRCFFMSNWDTMVKRHPGYTRLLERRGRASDPDSLRQAVERFSKQDLLDLQVWFNLSWFGFAALHDERIAPLLEKGSTFTEVEKNLVLDVQAEILGEVIPGWRKLLDGSKVEISTSPYYHPILPILIGTDIVRRSMPDATLPGDFSFFEDAKAQIERGVAYYRELFGRAPVGIWPSEGSVCPELVPLLADAGLKWMATDEAVLMRSLADGQREHDLYQPYRALMNGSEIAVFFRDRYLSDLVGFTYSKNPPEIAVESFIGHLGRIAKNNPGGTVSIILDGENPWEYYPDSGEGFLNGLFKHLVQDDRFRPVSMRQAQEEAPPTRTLSKLHSGSWINANYGIWIGGPEENQAWTVLNRTRGALELAEQSGKIAPEALQEAYEQLYQAEGSDWFWWYDDDFNSENDEEFDNLFRRKLANVYHALGQDTPAFLDEPIHVTRENILIAQPLALIQPTIDGQVTEFYEWTDAGYIDVSKTRGSMHLAKNTLQAFYFGFDRDNLYLRLDPSEECVMQGAQDLHVRIHLCGQAERMLQFPLALGQNTVTGCEMTAPNDQGVWESVGKLDRVRVDDVAEIAIPFALLDVRPGQPLWFVVHIMKGEITEDRFPKNGRVLIHVPDENYNSINWSV